MRRFSDDALLACLAVALGALFIAWATTLGRSWAEAMAARKEAKVDRDALLEKHGELAVEMAAMKEQIATLQEQWRNRPKTQQEEVIDKLQLAFAAGAKAEADRHANAGKSAA